MDLTQLSVCGLAKLLNSRSISSAELTEAYLNNISFAEPQINAYITVLREQALQAAAAVDNARADGDILPELAGIPFAVKDNICTKGIKTTCASHMLENFIPVYNASVIDRLIQNRLIILGKTNMDEFGMGSSTESSAFKPTRSPINNEYVPGGSSGGSAACVAAREAPFALASDTGGSVRQPASFCGTVGMKPTYGTVSRYGLIAFASSLDQIGVISKNVRDNAAVLNLISGYDRKDSTSLNRRCGDFTAELDSGIRGIRIGLPRELFGGGISREVRSCVLNAASEYESLGAELIDISMPSLNTALAAYYIISSAEASSNLARYDGIRFGHRTDSSGNITELYVKSRSEGFGTEVKCRIMLGTFVLSSGYYEAYYKKALRARSLIINDFARIFEQCDIVLSPTAPAPAYRLGEKLSEPAEMYLGDICTVPANIAGLPALSIPCGEDINGLPVGMQLTGKMFSENLLYRAGNAFEAAKGALYETH